MYVANWRRDAPKTSCWHPTNLLAYLRVYQQLFGRRCQHAPDRHRRPKCEALANKEIDRSARLNRVGAESDERLDERTRSQRAAAAAVKSAEAAIHVAQLNLEFTRIVAPFSGHMSRRHVSIGSLVTGGPGAASSTELTTIVSLDPVYLDFDMSEAEYAAYQRSAAARPAGANAVQVSLDGERPWSRTGDLDFLDNEIDRSSGSLHARATLANPDLAIAPGAFARVRVPLSATVPQLLVPDAAVGTDQSGKLVMVVRDSAWSYRSRSRPGRSKTMQCASSPMACCRPIGSSSRG
jgi:RND family efflux transporter MFP subunit